MKILPLIVVSCLAGGGLGAALAYVSVGPEPPLIDVTGAGADLPSNSTPLAKARIDEPEFDFGSMQRGTTNSHVFRVTNEGDAPLVLTPGETSCKCTSFTAGAGPIAPGGTGDVTLEWAAKVMPGPFRQTAKLGTNDPRLPQITLSVAGEVIDAVGLSPQDFSLGRIGADQSIESSVVFLSFDKEEMTVEALPPGATAIVDSTADGMLAERVPAERGPAVGESLPYTVEVTPLATDELSDDRAKAGVRVTLTAGPGLPVGVINEWVTLKTNLPTAESMLVPIFGRVEGDLSVRGFGWSADTGVLAMGIVDGAVGRKKKLIVSVKGDQATTANLAITTIDPPQLQASLGEPKQVRDGVVHVPLTVEAPAGTPPMVRLHTGRKPDGSYQHPEGIIRLTSSLESSPELIIRVRFAVR